MEGVVDLEGAKDQNNTNNQYQQNTNIDGFIQYETNSEPNVKSQMMNSKPSDDKSESDELTSEHSDSEVLYNRNSNMNVNSNDTDTKTAQTLTDIDINTSISGQLDKPQQTVKSKTRGKKNNDTKTKTKTKTKLAQEKQTAMNLSRK